MHVFARIERAARGVFGGGDRKWLFLLAKPGGVDVVFFIVVVHGVVYRRDTHGQHDTYQQAKHSPVHTVLQCLLAAPELQLQLGLPQLPLQLCPPLSRRRSAQTAMAWLRWRPRIVSDNSDRLRPLRRVLLAMRRPCSA